MKLPAVWLSLGLTAVAMAQTAADKITAGRAALAARDLATAQTRFQEALEINPTAQAAAALLGITRCFQVANAPAAQTFLNRLGVAATGRSVYRWDAPLTRDAQGNVVLPADFNLAELSTFWLGTLIPQSELARANFAVVTNPDFLISFSPAETGLPGSTNVDYADVLTLRAALRAAEFLAHLLSSQNLNANLAALQPLYQNSLLTLQRALADNPSFLTAGPLSERTAARAALLDTVALYRTASAALRARPAGLNRLFSIDPPQLAAEARFRADLDRAERSLTEPVALREHGPYVMLGSALTADWSLRSGLPEFSATGFDPLSLPDPTLGGAVVGLSREELAASLTRDPATVPELGATWVAPSPQGNTLNRHLTLSNGRQIAIGDAGTVLTSDNGSNWTVQNLPANRRLVGLASGANKVVAVGEGCIYVSANAGTTWTEVPNIFANLRAVTFGGSGFLAVGAYYSWSSATGDTWTGSYTGLNLFDVVYAGNAYVAVGQNLNTNQAVVLRSPTGATWTNQFTATTLGTTLQAVAHNGSDLFVAVGAGNQCVVSSGGLVWTAGSILPSGTTLFSGVGHRAGRFVAAGAGGTIASSADGVTWTNLSSGETATLTSVSSTPDALVVTGVGGLILRSTDNLTFARALPPALPAPTSATLLNLQTIDGQLYATGTAGTLLRSADGVTFSQITTGTGQALWSITKHDGTFLAVGDGGTLLSSADGTSWIPRTSGTTANLRTVAYLNREFVTAGANGTLLTSPDGLTWTLRPTGVSGTLYSVAYGRGLFVAVGGSNSGLSHVLTSADGQTWTLGTISSPSTFRSVVFAGGKFTAAGSGGIFAQSVDGLSWTVRTMTVPGDLLGLRYLDGRYYATQGTQGGGFSVANQAAILFSADGDHWVRCPLPTANLLYQPELFLGRLYTAGNLGSILRSRPLPALVTPSLRVLTPNRPLSQGGEIALAVAAQGDGLTYEWRKNGTLLPAGTGPGLEVLNAQLADAGSYTVAVTNAAGTLTSSPILLSIDPAPVAPILTTQPQGQSISVGLAAVFRVAARGTLPFSYQWKKDGEPISGATNDTWTIPRVQSLDAGAYTVSVTNAAGVATSLPAALTVDTNPVYTFSTIAGAAGFWGSTDGTGSAARFATPEGIAVDLAGNVYVADADSYCIRRITPGGLVTTLAGGAFASGNVNGNGTTARFGLPRGVAVEPGGAALYVADQNNHAIRKIVLATAVVTQFASVPSPVGVVCDNAGNLFVTSGQHTIQKVSPAGVVTVIAGSAGNSGFLNGIGAAARFSYPQGITLDATGYLYVADSGNYAVRRIGPDATVTTLAGGPTNYGSQDGSVLTASLSYPTGVAIDAAGSLYVVDRGASTIRKISGGLVRTIGGTAFAGGSIDGPGSAARFSSPAWLALDPAGNLFLTESSANTVRKGSPSSSPFAPIITVSPQGQTVPIGGSLTLGVTATGLAPFTYQWRRNGIALPGATSATLVLANLPASAAGDYAVLITNREGSALSPAAPVLVSPAPFVLTPPASQSVIVGGSALFTVTAAGTPTPTYQWRKDSANLPGATGSSWAVPRVATVDAGSYDVVLTNSAGSVTSPAASLSVVVPSSVSAVGTGNYHTFLLRSAGALAATGFNDYGQLGDGALATRNTPVSVATGVVAATGGFGHSLWLKSDRSLWGVGDNSMGQLGVGTTNDRYLAPVPIATEVLAAAAGSYFSLFIKTDGTLWATGANWGGQLGDGTNLMRRSPVMVATDVVAISAGNAHSLILKADASLWVTGTSSGLGDGSTASRNLPVQIATDVTAMSAGMDHSAFVKTDGTAWTVGWNLYGQLGDGTTTTRLDPVQVATGATAVSAGAYHTLFLKGNGDLWGAGWNRSGQLGDGTREQRNTPVLVASSVASVTSGGSHVLFFKTDGSLWATGSNYFGSLGDGSNADRLTPILLAGGPAAPTIVRQPASQSAGTGGQVDLLVSATGNPAPGYQWRKNGGIISGATNALLPLANLQPADAGAYTVVVSNSVGSVTSSAAVLTIADAPAITAAPAARTVVAGQSTTFTAAATGTPPLAYQWNNDGGAIPGATAAAFAIASVTPADAGSYSVVVTNATGSATSAPALLTVIVTPIIVAPPVAATVNTGATASFSVVATGTPAPVYQWRKGNSPLAGATAPTLILTQVQPADGGLYAVAVSNAAGSVVSDGVPLTVIAPAAAPAITTQPENQRAVAGQSITFAVAATGTAPLAFQWRKDGASLAGATNASLTIANVSTDGSGAYSVMVSNAAGSVTSRDALLSVIPVGLAAQHAVVGTGYVAGGTVQITTTITYPGTLTALAYQALLPAGWSYVSGQGTEGDVRPTPGTVDLLEWAWTTVPASPITFTYTLKVPGSTTGATQLVGLATSRPGPLQFIAQPDPLPVAQVTHHDADTDRNFRISLLELTRVIELYNTRFGTTRTGGYKVEAGSEDGFAADPARAGTATVTLARYHAADANRDGKLSLLELTRVIELYNYRSGTTRTGDYHVHPGSEDGFNPGPLSQHPGL